MKIKIELLSDLCTTSGETYNSLVDTDITYDEYGIPYIPAKRIKGCIREAALELVEFGIIDKSMLHKVFGGGESDISSFWLSNARVADYDMYVNDINNFGHKEITRHQNVIKRFTYMRTQTSVDKDTGVAKENSLRTIRVAKKGLVFEADCGELSSEFDINVFKESVSLVKHMGMSRTRGLGLVNMSLQDTDSLQKNVSHVQITKQELEEMNKIYYTIHLKSSMICKSASGNQAVSQNYIAGSKVLGLIASCMDKDEYKNIMDANRIIVSNAYIVNNSYRCVPAKISLQKQKDQSYDNNGKMLVYNMIYNPDVTGKQMTPAGIAYIDKDNRKVCVDMQISYHHRRPNDKSVGRATGEDGSSFYQLSSICAGQIFGGYIYADRNTAEKIIDALSNLGEVRMGYGRNSEFGAVDFKLERVEHCIEDKSNIYKDIEITLLSDVILYNDNGVPTTDLTVLKKYIEDEIGNNDLEIKSSFLNYVTIGGFNVTWNRRKPVFNAIGKGSVIFVHSEKGIDTGKFSHNRFIGERQYEGYGEMYVEEARNKAEVYILKEQIPELAHEERRADMSGIINDLLIDELDKKIYAYIVDNVIKSLKDEYKKNSPAGINAALAKLRLIYKDVSTYEEMCHQISELVKTDKKNICLELCEKVNPEEIVCDKVKELKEIYNMDIITAYNDSELYKKVYGIYISELKYLVKNLAKKEEKK